MRIVLDTNVLVSATWWLGNARELLVRGLDGEIHIILSDDILAEYRSVMQRKKFSFVDGRSIQRFTQLLEERFQIIHRTVPVLRVTEDSSDGMVLACARAARADLIVTGDSHLLKLGRWAGIRIVSPREAIKIINAADGK